MKPMLIWVAIFIALIGQGSYFTSAKHVITRASDNAGVIVPYGGCTGNSDCGMDASYSG